jgi:DNA-binding GntR family transcriptional regulator
MLMSTESSKETQVTAVNSATANGAPPQLLKDRAYLALKQQILGGHLPAGHFLSERRVARELGMSKTPVREALERLLGERLVSVSPQQGYVVRGCSLSELADHYEFRLTLEPFFLRQAAGNLSADQSLALTSQVEQQAEALAVLDVDRAIELDVEFHLLFAQFADNREMLRVMRRLCERMARVVSQSLRSNPTRHASTFEEHRRIAEAVIAGDGELAAALLTDHLEHCRASQLSRAAACDQAMPLAVNEN